METLNKKDTEKIAKTIVALVGLASLCFIAAAFYLATWLGLLVLGLWLAGIVLAIVTTYKPAP